ncbi:hypothetical protein [Asticcacaulis solisilvae]|uniref:hypothetical protein n=1 Tax=Asticcacaulis solisilvae TaxID=1217274 RepID=UPI003FD7FCF3
MWPFKRQPLLDEDTAQWHIDNACWFLRHFGRTPMVADARLVLPGRGYFRLRGDLAGIDLAREILKQMKAFIGRSDWSLDVAEEGEADENTIIVSWETGDDPYRLVCLLGYEMAWRVLASVEEDPPCDEDNWPELANAASCFMGFGVIIADQVMAPDPQAIERFRKTKVWDAAPARWTWLPEAEIVFDLAIFLTFKDLDAGRAIDFLKPLVGETLKAAMADVAPYRKLLLDARDGFWSPAS